MCHDFSLNVDPISIDDANVPFHVTTCKCLFFLFPICIHLCNIPMSISFPLWISKQGWILHILSK